MNRQVNGGTQPHSGHPVFNNWDVVPLAWYLLGASDLVRPGAIRAFELCGQRVVVFRGVDGGLRALDAFCPHMGTDLAIGRVEGNEIRCFFHHWQFNGEGRCTHIPAGEPVPPRARLHAYDVREKYGFVWIWPAERAPAGVPEYPELAGLPVYALPGRPIIRPCHHNINMINGLDAQHLRTVHQIPIEMMLKTTEEDSGRVIEFRMEGELPGRTFFGRMLRRLLGGRYAYSMRYVDASLGLLRTLEDVRWFGRAPAEPTRMIFAYTPLGPGKTQVQPIYIARKPAGWLGRCASYTRLLATALGFRWLRDEDGAIYDNIRFQTQSMLKIDQGLVRFIGWVNRLPLSRWSTTRAYDKLPGEPAMLETTLPVSEAPAVSAQTLEAGGNISCR